MMMTKRREFPKPVWRRVKKLTVRAPKAAGGLAGVGRPRTMKSWSRPCSTSCAPGIPWRDLPERFGPWGSVYTRFRRWCARGPFARLLAAVAKGAKGELRYIDCSPIKLHQDG